MNQESYLQENNILIESDVEKIDEVDNEIEPKIYNASLKLEKKIDVSYAVVGDIVNYTIEVSNDGNALLENIIIYDELSSDLAFINGSLAIDGYVYENIVITRGININSLDAGQSKILTFSVEVISNKIHHITNPSIGKYKYSLPHKGPQLGVSESNQYILNIIYQNIDVLKKLDKYYAEIGDIINYTVTLINNGNVDTNNIIYIDTLSEEVEFMSGSFSVNGVTISRVNLNSGVNIGDIGVGAIEVVKYSVKVVSKNLSMKIINSVYLDYSYTLPNGSTKTSTVEPNKNSTNIVNLMGSRFKELYLEEILAVSTKKPEIKEVKNISGLIKIQDYHVLNNSVQKCYEDQMLTEYKLILNGVTIENVEYISYDNKIYTSKYTIPFCASMVLPYNYKLGDKLDISGTIENIYSEFIGSRELYNKIEILLSVNINGL